MLVEIPADSETEEDASGVETDSKAVLLSPDDCTFEPLDGTLLFSGVSAEALCEDDAACEALDETGGADSAGVLSGVDADALADSSAVCCCAS
ncbi:hypothetical protein FYJ76_13445 [Ruthenibacterium lactatiformans]|uniref:Uncharacterized protein n=1 Tax=Ruthenibacterium lactatiformans TaxID=1550024 RepID=A0A6I2UC18_9FIRM|nr:hypothetical protein [Ruthenibacterium lactatiformans]MST92920.1 hypothetical protein [Ruthenibacterium lactatiformans]